MAKIDSIREIKDYKTWWTQILFWRTHMDVFLQQYFQVKLKDVQQIIARCFGNCSNIKLVQSRGFGKTWLTAWCCIGQCILYPNTKVAVVSATAQQATLVLKKIKEFTGIYPQLRREMKMIGRDYVTVSKDKGKCEFMNGSGVESFSLTTVVGERAKVLVIDEAPRASEQEINKNATPVLNTTRDICIQHGFDDFDSKMVSITSACLKSNYFYTDFLKAMREMGAGNDDYFCSALDWKSAVRVGISKRDYFDGRRKELPESVFATEYESMFLGEEANSVFRYEMTEGVRTLKNVEYRMPKNSKCYYVISVDLATSKAKGADNASITVIKCTEREDGSIMKQVVYMRTYHGKQLDDLADEVRRTYVRFPNTIKIVFDHRGLGDAFHLFFQDPWIDPLTGKEYPPWVPDSERSFVQNAEPLLYSFKANIALNQQMASCLRVAIEQKTIALPIESHMAGAKVIGEDDEEHKMTPEEYAIYLEADALQVEMGNIVMKTSGAGNYTYDSAKPTQHKDRYSSLAMGVWYIAQLEDDLKKKIHRKRMDHCIGIVSHF